MLPEPLPILDDIPRVEKQVDMMQEQRQDSQHQLQALTLVLHDLRSQHEQVGRDMRVFSASIAPIHKLPLEILSIIFCFCALEDIDTPLTLLRVCRRWQEAATAPQIWSRIVIDFDDRYVVDRTTLYLARSKSTPLDVVLCLPGYNNLGLDAWYRMLDHSSRWRTLEISAATHDQVNHILDGLPSYAPNLVHATFTVQGFLFLNWDYRSKSTMLRLRRKFLDYPKFSSLHLQTWAIPSLTLNPRCVLSQLTSLHVTDTYANTFHTADRMRPHPICGNAISWILKFCSSLQNFTLNARDSVAYHSGKSCRDPEGVTRNVFTLPTLTNLTIIAHHIDTFAILNSITVPGVKTLHIEPLPRYAPYLVENLSNTWKGLFRRSKAPPLEVLNVFAMVAADVKWTLEHSPKLRRFHLTYCTNPESILEALASPYTYKGRGKLTEEPRWLSPKLERIYLDECFQVPWRSVAHLLQRRHRAYLETKALCRESPVLILDLLINGHDVLDRRDLDTLVYLKTRQIETLIEP